MVVGQDCPIELAEWHMPRRIYGYNRFRDLHLNEKSSLLRSIWTTQKRKRDELKKANEISDTGISVIAKAGFSEREVESAIPVDWKKPMKSTAREFPLP